MRVISVINQKGGCGKTTTAINLCGCLSQLNRRVLLVDLDPQGHASLGLNLNPEDVRCGMTEVMTQSTGLEEVIRVADGTNLDVAPANITLSTVEQLLADAAGKEGRLLNKIEGMQRNYDYVIIDSPPSLGILTFNALRASDLSIVPIDMGFFSLHGVTKLIEIIDLVSRHTGHKVQLRALATMVSLRTRFTREVLEEIRQHFEGNVFRTLIRNNVRLREATSHGVPISHYDRRSAGANDYRAVAEEVLAMEVSAEAKVPELVAVEQNAPVGSPDEQPSVSYLSKP
ncbi:MAG: ParA family protein [Deltaproteobacteria bacterium]|nr:ParA family protein [Deltaproteobacteria bacterium]